MYLLFVIFAETGLFFGFFLPGDYLLFLAGMFVATDRLDVGIITLIVGFNCCRYFRKFCRLLVWSKNWPATLSTKRYFFL
jgi:membrane-associated protein